MAKVYWHVFCTNRRNVAFPTVWMHEASRDTKYDAYEDVYGLKRDGYRTRVIRSPRDPMDLLRELNLTESMKVED